MEHETTEQFIVRMGITQLEAFKEFQDREMEGGMTIRDLDVWLGAYISGISHYYASKKQGTMTEEKFKEALQLITSVISECKVAKQFGATGILKEEITTFNTKN